MKCVKPVCLGSKETRLGAVTMHYNGHGKAISLDEIVSGDQYSHRSQPPWWSGWRWRRSARCARLTKPRRQVYHLSSLLQPCLASVSESGLWNTFWGQGGGFLGKVLPEKAWWPEIGSPAPMGETKNQAWCLAHLVSSRFTETLNQKIR